MFQRVPRIHRAMAGLTVLLVTCVGVAGGARADESTWTEIVPGLKELTRDRLRFQVGYLLRGFYGTTRVREFGSRPATLALHRDLGLSAQSGMHAEALWDGDTVRLLAEADYLFLSGGGERSDDFAFDEGNFVANQPFDVSGYTFFLRGTIAFKTLIDLGESAWLGPVIGVEYPNMLIEIDQPGVDSTGEHWSQFAPYPIIGVAGEWKISPTLDLRGRVTGSYVSDWKTLRHEGGRLFMTAKTVMSEALLSWRATPHLHLSAGIQYQYWDGELRSHEDGNELTFSSPGLILGAELRF